MYSKNRQLFYLANIGINVNVWKSERKALSKLIYDQAFLVSQSKYWEWHLQSNWYINKVFDVQLISKIQGNFHKYPVTPLKPNKNILTRCKKQNPFDLLSILWLYSYIMEHKECFLKICIRDLIIIDTYLWYHFKWGIFSLKTEQNIVIYNNSIYV